MSPLDAAAPLRLGTRRSALARAQAEAVADALRVRGHLVELVEVTTRGDESAEPLAQIGGTGVFVSALREALLAGSVDLAVHSLKDLPVAVADGIALAAVPPRADARDVLVAGGPADGRTIDTLPGGARVGTGSPRRAAQLLARRPDLEVAGIRGNVDTRLRRVAEGGYDAVLLAYAGLQRLGRLAEVTEVVDPEVMLPAPGQGALAVETLESRADVLAAVGALDDVASRSAVGAERAVLATLEAGCTAPVGALAEVSSDGRELWLRVAVGARRTSASGPVGDPEGLGRRLAHEVLNSGVDELWGARAT